MKGLEVTLLEFGKGTSKDADGGKAIVRADQIVTIDNSNDGKARIYTHGGSFDVNENYETAREKWRKVLEEFDASV